MKKLFSKYVKQIQKNILIYPSEINFLRKDELKLDDQLLEEINAKLNHFDENQYPKLQVSQINGIWFALNSTMLFVFQNLEKEKKCERIQVEVVPLNKVPIYLQKEMVINDYGYRSSKSSSSNSYCSSCLNNTVTTFVSNSNLNTVCTKNGLISKAKLRLNELTNELKNNSSLNKSLIETSENSFSSECSNSDENELDTVIKCENFFKCNVCNRSFTTIKLLINHKLRKKHFECTMCKQRFKNSKKLHRHQETNKH